MVLQIALTMAGHSGFCLERVSTRLFRGSRHDFVRVVTSQTQTMVQTMLSSQAADAEKKHAFSQAADSHAQSTKDVMLGEGIDLHLGVLRFKSKCNILSETDLAPPVKLISYNVRPYLPCSDRLDSL